MNKDQKISVLLLLIAKTFERLGFYLIMAILIQYLMDSLKIDTEKAGSYYSTFYYVIGISTIFSGVVGDLTNRIKVVKTGFILLTFFCLALTFLPNLNFAIITALILLGLGIGLISPNLIVFFGNIYNEKEKQLFGLTGFVLLSVAINIGALIAPSLAIFLKSRLGYSSIFLSAFGCWAISLILFWKFTKLYSKLDIIAKKKGYSEDVSTRKLNRIILISVLIIGAIIPLALYQNGLTVRFYMRDSLVNSINFMRSLNTEKYISIVFLGIFAIIASRLKQLKWKNIFNTILAGIVIAIIAFIIISGYDSLSKLMSGKLIFVKVYIIFIITETLISPTMSYVIYRSSPLKFKGLFQGIKYVIAALSLKLLFIGTIIYDKLSSSMTFIVFAIILIISGILIVALNKYIQNRFD